MEEINKMKTFRFVSLIILLTSLLIAGCAATRKPLFLSDTFEGQLVDDIYVLPVLDLRFDKTKELKLDKWVHSIVAGQLKKKNYKYQIVNKETPVAGLTEEILAEENPSLIISMKPDGARWVMLLVLHDSSSKLTFGSTGNAEMSGRLYDMEMRNVVWRDKAVAQTGQGGLIGMAMKGAMEQQAITMAALNLINSFPARQ